MSQQFHTRKALVQAILSAQKLEGDSLPNFITVSNKDSLPNPIEFGIGIIQTLDTGELYSSNGVSVTAIKDSGSADISISLYGANGPLTWQEGSIYYTATYNTDGTLATVTGGGIVKTFTYSAGQLTSVTTGTV